MPNDVRYALFDESRFEGSIMKDDGGIGRYEKSFQAPTQKNAIKRPFHGLDLSFLFSHEWLIKGFANIP